MLNSNIIHRAIVIISVLVHSLSFSCKVRSNIAKDTDKAWTESSNTQSLARDQRGLAFS